MSRTLTQIQVLLSGQSMEISMKYLTQVDLKMALNHEFRSSRAKIYLQFFNDTKKRRTQELIKKKEWKKLKYILSCRCPHKYNKKKYNNINTYLPVTTKRLLNVYAVREYEYKFDLKTTPYPSWFDAQRNKWCKKQIEIYEKKQQRLKDNRKTECCICLETKKGKDFCHSKTCSHSVCYKCYGDAMQSGNPIMKCPLCRGEFTEGYFESARYTSHYYNTDTETDDNELNGAIIRI